MSPIGWATGTLSPIRGDRHPFLKISLFSIYFWNFIFLNIKMKKVHLRPPPSSLSWASPSGLPHAMHMHQHSLSLCVTVLVLLTHQLRQSVRAHAATQQQQHLCKMASIIDSNSIPGRLTRRTFILGAFGCLHCTAVWTWLTRCKKQPTAWLARYGFHLCFCWARLAWCNADFLNVF